MRIEEPSTVRVTVRGHRRVLAPRGRSAIVRLVTGVAVVGLLGMASCSPSVTDLQLHDGRSVNEVVGTTGRVVLVYDPKDCIACDAVALRWLELRSSDTAAVRLFLTREPSSFERRRLAIQRLRVDGVLAKSWFRRRVSPPAEYLLGSGDDTTLRVAHTVADRSELQRAFLQRRATATGR